MRTYIKYANATKPIINNNFYLLLNFFEPVDAFEEQPEATYATKQANCKTHCKQIHFLSF